MSISSGKPELPRMPPTSPSSSTGSAEATITTFTHKIIPPYYPERRDFLVKYTQRVAFINKHHPGILRRSSWKVRFIIVTSIPDPKDQAHVYDILHSFKSNEPLKWEEARLRLTHESLVCVTDELGGNKPYVIKLTGLVPSEGGANYGFITKPEQPGVWYLSTGTGEELSSWLSFFKTLVHTKATEFKEKRSLRHQHLQDPSNYSKNSQSVAAVVGERRHQATDPSIASSISVHSRCSTGAVSRTSAASPFPTAFSPFEVKDFAQRAQQSIEVLPYTIHEYDDEDFDADDHRFFLAI